VTNTSKVTANAEPMNTGIMIVDLADIQDTLVKRGRESYRNEELENALASLAVGKGLVWQDATVPQGLSDKAQTAFRGKMRNRLVSCAKVVGVDVSVTWNNAGVMIVMRKA
jgi:exo-beta-1,3-glucanase (GH17 family)